MIDITIDGYSVKIIGHARQGFDTQPCARVSTVHQIMGKLLIDKVKEYDDQSGYSYIKLDGLNKTEIDMFNKLCECYDELASPELYNRLIRVTKRNIGKPVVNTDNIDVDKPKRGRKPANKEAK